MKNKYFTLKFLKNSYCTFLLALLTFSKLYSVQDSTGMSIVTHLNLEDLAQDFVLETKQIQIPEYKDAFNPSIIRWNDAILMVFRIRNPENGSTNQMGFIWLDEAFNPISSPQVLERRHLDPLIPSQAQDPRLISIDHTLYLLYNDVKTLSSSSNRRMFIAEVHSENGSLFTEKSAPLIEFEGANEKRQEKNWVPFNYKDNLLLSYSLSPHRVLLPVLGTNQCQTVALTQGALDWKWGELRGGTPALLVGNQYLAFFHSCKDMITTHSNGVRMVHYFMGAYTFNAEPPFEITGMSPEPIVGDHFYEGPAYKTWKPLRVVFPGGFLFDEQHIWIAYGRQDHEIWIAKLDKQKLLESLTPIVTRNFASKNRMR